jgi:hypothetical protein
MWYYSENNRQYGPFEDSTIKQMVRGQTIRASTLVWRQGMAGWLPARSTELAPLVAEHGQIAPPISVQLRSPGNIYKSAEMQIKEINDLFMWSWICLIGMVVTFGVSGIASIVLFYVILYRCWNLIQDGYARTTAGNAVGFCFIPFYNFYWIFQAFQGLAKDTNTFVMRYHLPISKQDETLPLVYCILTLFTAVISWIPYVGLIFAVPLLIIEVIMFRNFKDAALSIIRSRN